MNLSEEREYMKLQETLDALGLTEANRGLAERYLDLTQPENPDMLKEAEHQDLSLMGQDERSKTRAYVDHCEKRKKADALGRFVRLTAAIGGSTAYYALIAYPWNLNEIAKYISREAFTAMMAESKAWNANLMLHQSLRFLYDLGQKEPDVLYRAQELCYHRFGNGRVLLTGIYLHCVKQEHPVSGFLKQLFGRGERPEITKAVQFVEQEIRDSLKGMFKDPALSDDELKLLCDFMEKDSLRGPLPSEIMDVIRAHKVSGYLLTLLGGAAFLALPYSARFQSFLRICLAADSRQTLTDCKDIAIPAKYTSQEELLESLLPIPTSEYLTWCIGAKQAAAIGRIARSEPELIRRSVEQSTSEQYAFLLESVRKAQPQLYAELQATYSNAYLEKMAAEVTKDFSAGQAEAKAYLMEEGELSSVLPFVSAWRTETYLRYRGFQELEQMADDRSRFLARALVLAGLRLHGYFFTNLSWRHQGSNPLTVQELVGIYQQEQLPLSYQLESYEAIYNTYYGDRDKTGFLDKIVKGLVKNRETYLEDIRLGAANSTAVGRYLCIRVLDRFWQQEKETLLACAQDSSKMVKGLLEAVYGSHREWEPEVLALLSSKKSQERELAVLVLRKWGTDRYRKQLEEALEKEKSKKLQELIRGSLGLADQDTDGTDGHVRTPRELATEILKGGKKRKIAWVLETPGTAVTLKDGSEAPEEYLQAILVSYADMSVPGFSPDAKVLAGELAADRLADFMVELFGKWLENNAEAKKKWVLYAASIHGGEQIIPLIHHQIQEWPQYARGAMAAEAVKALALNGSSEALLLVDNISRKFKFRQVKTAAGEALSYAAEQMNISREELEDRIVPGLGFGEDMSRIFDYGPRTFTVYLTPDLELEVLDKDQKRLKTLPAPGKRDEEEKAAAAYGEFKQLKKQLKTVVTNQKLRLEQALTAERQWKSDQWTALFVKNPVMHQFAIGLIWGVYEQGTLKDTFRYMEDGSFNTVDEEEYELPTEGMIGLVHPVELDAETIGAWKEQLSDYEVTQPIPQLERQVFDITEEERQETELTRFGGKIMNGLSLTGKLQTMGWYRGSVQDGGVYTTFYREDGEIGVELEFSGIFVGGENEDVTVYGATFYKAGTVKRGSYVYDTIKPENRYRLGEVNARYFSEIVYQLTKATASSQEQAAYPECRK